MEEGIRLEDDGPILSDDDEAPGAHVVPESSHTRWGPIEDLDSFFTRTYQYHQRHGFNCIMLQQVLELLLFVFFIAFFLFLTHFVDYPVLFRDKLIGNDTLATKISLADAIYAADVGFGSMGLLTWCFLLIALVYLMLRLVRLLYEGVQCFEIKQFYNNILKIPECEIDNMTWHEVQRRLMIVQRELEMCVQTRELTQLDICHRILRFKNYSVAMVNKNLLPVHLYLPLVGDFTFLPRAYKFNIEMLLFRGPWSPFENSWHLKEAYKRVGNRKALADEMSRNILIAALLNLMLTPVIFIWLVFLFFVNNADMIKREPGSLGLRCWSQYSRLYLRHFNELDHELNARLSRAYRPATKYLNIFTSPMLAILARFVLCFFGTLFVVLAALTVYDEDVLTANHVLTDLSVLGAILAVARVFIPDENVVWCPEQLMASVLAHVHYLPANWHGQAHTASVRVQFSSLFPYKIMYLLQELLAPLVTPFVLYFKLRPKALDIVDFFRQFSVEVTGVGDVCAFAQMDIRRHGNSSWQPADTKVAPDDTAVQCAQAEDGKIELSLLHFTLTNPDWKMPSSAEQFVGRVREATTQNLRVVPEHMGLSTQTNSMSGIASGDPYNALAMSFLQFRDTNPNTNNMEASNPFVRSVNQPAGVDSRPDSLVMRGAVSRTEGPSPLEIGQLMPEPRGLTGIRGAIDPHWSLGASMFGMGPDVTHADMAASALYLHSMHHRQTRRRTYGIDSSLFHQSYAPAAAVSSATASQQNSEKLPLLLKQ